MVGFIESLLIFVNASLQPLSVNGDMDTWEVYEEKPKLQSSCELPLLHGTSAGPLPVKYKLVAA